MTVKAVVDTNIWVSALLNPSGFPAKLRKSFEEGAFLSIISAPLVEEIADVLTRPRIKNKYGITEEDIRELLILLEERSEHVILSGNINVCRDKDDDVIIETALKGQAGFIVSRDDDVKFDKDVSEFLSKFDIAVLSTAKFLALISRT